MKSMATGTGKVYDVIREFEWKIDDFFSLKENGLYSSPLFKFFGEPWHFSILPNDQSQSDTVDVGIYLFRSIPDAPPLSLVWNMSLKKVDGTMYKQTQFSHVFDKPGGYGTPSFLPRSEVIEKKSQLVPSGILTVVCRVEYISRLNGSGPIPTDKCSHCGLLFDTRYLPSHQKKCPHKFGRCPTCKDIISIGNWFSHECQMTRVKANEKLVNDLSSIFHSEEHSDVTIRVKGQEFRLHRSILAGRNAYFNSMFNADMQEKTTGIVTINDCEPDIFRSFIQFLYTGKVDDLRPENVCDLYEVADKYQEDDMKAECLCFMKKKITVDSFCDFIVLAFTHDENELLQSATEFFGRNVRDIIQSAKWQEFLKEYPLQANVMHIRALDYYAK